MAEDLANTPAERAAKLAAEGSSTKSTGAGADAFADATTVTIGGEPGHIIIVGAGLVGSLCAVVLLRKGFKVDVYERYQDIRDIPSVGRSINLSVTSRGLRAVRELGGNLYDKVVGIATKVKGRIVHLQGASDPLFARYGKDDTECNYSISRIELNKLLINVAAEEGANYYFDHALSESSNFSCQGETGSALHFVTGSKTDSPQKLVVRALCPVIGCDGAGSRLRYALQHQGLTSFTEDMMAMGYKEVLFPKPPDGQDFGAKGDNGGEACEGRYGLHIWPRGGHFLMALSNLDGSFTGTIYMNKIGDESFATFDNTPEGKQKCFAFCEKYYSEAAPLVGGMDALVRQITENPTGILGTVRCDTWAVGGKVVLIGDATHAMVPFFGQGCNCGFEDTLWLSRLLDKHCGADGKISSDKCTDENFAACFKELEAERKANALAICEMAIENANEMGAKTADTKFQAMKKLENRLENAMTEKFRSRYAMVCYGGAGNVTYANAQKLGVVQNEILEKLCDGLDKLDGEEAIRKAVAAVDLDVASKLIDEMLVPVQRELCIDLSTVRH